MFYFLLCNIIQAILLYYVVLYIVLCVIYMYVLHLSSICIRYVQLGLEQELSGTSPTAP